MRKAATNASRWRASDASSNQDRPDKVLPTSRRQSFSQIPLPARYRQHPWGAWQASIQPLRRIMTINGPRQFYVAYATQIRPSHVNLRVRSPVMEGLLTLFACIRTVNPSTFCGSRKVVTAMTAGVLWPPESSDKSPVLLVRHRLEATGSQAARDEFAEQRNLALLEQRDALGGVW